MAKFFAPGRGGDFCKHCNLSTGSTENEVRISLVYLFHTIHHATKMSGFEI